MSHDGRESISFLVVEDEGEIEEAVEQLRAFLAGEGRKPAGCAMLAYEFGHGLSREVSPLLGEIFSIPWVDEEDGVYILAAEDLPAAARSVRRLTRAPALLAARVSEITHEQIDADQISALSLDPGDAESTCERLAQVALRLAKTLRKAEQTGAALVMMLDGDP